MDSEKSILLRKGCLEKVIKTFLYSHKSSTHSIYLKIWKKFESWCRVSRFSLEHPDILLILDFLQDGLDLSPSTLRFQVSAPSALYDSRLSQVSWISRFLNTADKLKPPVKKRMSLEHQLGS